MLAEVIVITCPDPPTLVYETREDLQQLLRRIKFVLEITSPDDIPRLVQQLKDACSPVPVDSSVHPPTTPTSSTAVSAFSEEEAQGAQCDCESVPWELYAQALYDDPHDRDWETGIF